MKITKLAIGAIAGALLIVGGSLAVETDKAVDNATSTFTKSNFDYIVVTPSNQQVAEYKANTQAVETVFPVYNYNTTLKGGNNYKVNLLVGDNMADYDITFFNPRRIESGEYKEDGIMLDTLAARKLNVKVGDEVSFTLNTSKFTLQVSAIYSEVKYSSMNNGVAMAKYTEAMKNAFSTQLSSYDLVFIAAKDKAKCADMLKNYIPWGSFNTFEEYKEKTAQSGVYTEEQLQEMYELEKTQFANSGPFRGYVQDKATYMAGAEDTVSTKKQNTFRLSILFAIIVPVALAGGLIGYDALTKAKDETEKSNGRSRSSYLKSKLIDNCVSVGIATGVSLIGVIVYGAIRSSMNVGTILLYSLPAIAAFLIALPFVFLFTKSLYGAKEAEPAIETPAPAAPEEADKNDKE